MKRPYQIFIVLFLLSSITFSQSGTAKSLEIGNQWVYHTSNGSTYLVQVQKDTIIDNTSWAIVGNNIQRADSTTIYNYNVSTPYWQKITFNENDDTVFVYGKYRKKIEYRFKLPTIPDEHNWIIIEGIGKTYYKNEQWYNYIGNYQYSETLVACRINGIDYGDTTLLDVEEEINTTIPHNFKLSQNYPNPFNPTTQIAYELPHDSNVEMVIYNTLGEEVNKLVSGNQAIGRYTINWNGQNSLGEQVPGGVYFYALRTKDFTKTRKMLLLR